MSGPLCYSADTWTEQLHHFIQEKIGQPVYVAGNSLGEPVTAMLVVWCEHLCTLSQQGVPAAAAPQPTTNHAHGHPVTVHVLQSCIEPGSQDADPMCDLRWQGN